MVRSRKPQLTRPEKSLKLELHEKRESRGLCILEDEEGKMVEFGGDLIGLKRF
jgi:hypothetical protein